MLPRGQSCDLVENRVYATTKRNSIYSAVVPATLTALHGTLVVKVFQARFASMEFGLTIGQRE